MQRIGKALLKSFQDYPRIRRELVSDRNARWVPQIAALLAKPGPHLVVVGAFHLPGDEGVLRRLEKAGLRVEQP